MKKSSWQGSFFCFAASFIWGVAFVAQSVGMEHVGPFTFNAVRNFLGSAVLLPVIFLMGRLKKDKDQEVLTPAEKKAARKQLILGGICCGIALCIASNFQQFGIKETTVGKAGFITALYIVLVPIVGIFMKKKAGFKVWIGVMMSVVGLYLLCMTESFTLSRGDFLVLLCAGFYTCHILIIDHFAPKVDGVKMSCIQFFVCAVITSVGMFVLERPNVQDILAAGIPIAYAGIMSSGVAYTFQILGQARMNPTVASLIMSLESVFSVLAGMVILHETMSGRETLGCVLMFAAIILCQLPDRKKKTAALEVE